MDPRLLKEWVSTAEGLGKSLVAFLGIPGALWIASTQLLDPIFRSLNIPPQGVGIVAALCMAGFFFLLLMSFRRFVQASRLEKPDAFTLRPDSPETLIGRTEDLTKLLNCVRQYRLVLLDGESGCGKSALVSAGLVHELRQADGLLPVVVRDWGEDWIRGPLSASLGALFQTVDLTERSKLGWTSEPDLAAAVPSLAADLEMRINAVFSILDRRILFITDQFDDYQARHRNRFVNADGNWLAPSVLASSNKFWHLISDGLNAGRLHLLVISRADTAASMASVRFLADDLVATRTLARVEVDYLHALLQGVTKKDPDSIIVSHPEGGWQQLQEHIEHDLREQGSILMQQVRTVLLGLRQLPLLTPKQYYAVGGLHGVETLVISRALSRASNAAGGGEVGRHIARAILGTLVLPSGANQPPKVRRVLLSEIKENTGNSIHIDAVLDALQQEEVVRPAEAVIDTAWQLDHDYLAGAVLAEARQANRWAITLQEGKSKFDKASGDWQKRLSSLLSIRTLWRIYWERFQKRLNFGEALPYVLISTSKPVTLIMLLTLIGVTTFNFYQSSLLDIKANRIISQFGAPSEKNAVITVWKAPEALRQRVYKLIVQDDGNLQRAAKNNWHRAHVGLEPSKVRDIVLMFRSRLERETNAEISSSFAKAYADVASRLNDQEVIKVEVTALRQRLEQETEEGIAKSFAQAYATVASRLNDQEVIKVEVIALRQRLEREKDLDIGHSLAEAYVSVTARLNNLAVINAEADRLLQWLKLKPNATTAANFARAYAVVAVRTKDPEAVRVGTIALRHVLEQAKGTLAAEEAAKAYASLASQLNDQDIVIEEVTALRQSLERETNWRVTANFAVAYASVATLLNDSKVVETEVTVLRKRIERELDEEIVAIFLHAYAAIAARLNDPKVLEAEVTAIRQRLETDTKTSQDLIVSAYRAVAVRLKEPKVIKDEAIALRKLLIREPRTENAVRFALAYAAIAARLNDSEVMSVEMEALRQRLEKEQRAENAYNLVLGYAAIAGQLDEVKVIKSEANALQKRLEHEENPFIREELWRAYRAVVVRLNDPKDIKVEITALQQLLEGERNKSVKGDSLRAYAALAAKLNDQELIKLMIPLLRQGLLEQRKDSIAFFSNEPVQAYVSVVAKLVEPEIIKREAAIFRQRLESETDANLAGSFALAYAALAARTNESLVKIDQISELLTLAGSPIIYNHKDLLKALKPISRTDFGDDLGSAVYWATKTYGIKPETLRPSFLNSDIKAFP